MTEETLFLKNLEGALEELQEIPLFGSPPPFSWEAFSDALSQLFEDKTFSLTHHKTEWLEKENITTGMGTNPLIQPFALSPLPGTLLLIMPKESKEILLEQILTKKNLSDETLEEGFFNFLCLNFMNTFNQMGIYGNLTTTLSDDHEMPDEGALCIDVSVQLNDKPLWARIAIPCTVHASFRTHFTMEKPPFIVDPALQMMPLSLKFQIGSTTLPAKDWKNIQIGDLLLLDRCTYDLENQKGNAQLCLGSVPLFAIRIKEKEIKILEYAFYQEENPMTDEQPPEEELTPKEEIEEAPSLEEGEEEKAPLWSPEEEKEEKPLLASKNIPITLTVEAARVKMPLEKVTQLKPGNVLDLSISPEAGVSLTVNDQCIAKGELVRIGESIGVKILKLGD